MASSAIAPLPDGFDTLAWVARNRAALSGIAYSADDHEALRLRLRSRLPAALPGWNATLAETEGGSDFATLITDLAAALLANLAAHADHRANESLLRTATSTRALMDHAALVDLRLNPGASASTLQAFIAKKGTGGTLAAGSKLSFTTDERKELIFETALALAVDASRNAMRLKGWDRSSRSLRLENQAFEEQDSMASLDAEYPGLRAGHPLVFKAGTRLLALPLTASQVVGEGAAARTQIRWSRGQAPTRLDLPIAELRIAARARQVAQLAQAARADELPAGLNRIPLTNNAPFPVGAAVVVKSSALRFGARVLAHSGNDLVLSRGLPTALRRSQTEVQPARWCGLTGMTLRPGTVALPRSPDGHQPYPHTPAPGDVLLMADASGVELATVASVSSTGFLINEPLARGLRPGAAPNDSRLLVRFYALDPDGGGSRGSIVAPVRLQDLPRVYDGSDTLLELDRACDALVVGSTLAVSDGEQSFAGEVDSVDTVDKRTLVRVRGRVPGSMQAIKVSVFGAFEHQMRVDGWDRSDRWLEAGATEIEIDGAPTGLTSGMQLVLSDGAAAEGVRVTRVQAQPGRAPTTRLSLQRPTERRYFLAHLVVHGNVASVSHGAGDRDEIVGSGNPLQAPQRFMLKRSPLAFVPDATTTNGLAPALEVFIGGRRWQRVDTLAASTATDTHYALEIDEQQRGHLVFGDGVRGATPPSGRDNITARYRTGLGRAGNLGAGGLVKQVAPAPFVASSFNPLPASGGAERDTPAVARERVMRHSRTLGRAVTLADHAELAMSYGGVAAARADWVNEGRGAGARRLLVVSVASTGGQPLAPTQREALLAWLVARSAEPTRVRVRGHRPWPVRLALQVTLKPDYVQSAVQAALLQSFGSATLADGTPAYFAFERRALGSALVLSEVYRVAETTEGVEHALATAFHPEAEPATVADRITVPADAQARGGHASDASIGRLEIALSGGVPG